MRRQITGLHAADRCAADQVPDGIFLVRVQRVQFRRQAQKPYYTLALAILEPSRFAGHILSSRLYCTPKALWTLELVLQKTGFGAEKIWSQRGDAHNHLFQLVWALRGYIALRRHAASKNGAAGSSGHRSGPAGWQVNAALRATEAIYYPLGLVLDRWLERKGLLPELVAIAITATLP